MYLALGFNNFFKTLREKFNYLLYEGGSNKVG